MSNPTATQVIGMAAREIGTQEKPAGSNRVKYTKWYGLTGPWCAMFVSWVAHKTGATKIIPKHAYTPSGAAWFKKRSQWGSRPRRGAIAYYNIGGLGRISHVGIVEKVHSDGSWTAIEGNTDARGGRTGGKVMRKRRNTVGKGGGFGYPAYGAGKPAPKAKKPWIDPRQPIRMTPPKFPLPAGHWYGKESSNPRNHSGYWSKDRAGIKTLQKRLIQLGYPVREITGRYDTVTAGSVARFQRKHGLTVDAEVGAITWNRLWREIS